MTPEIPTRVAALAVRTGQGRPMRELAEARAEVDGGLVEDIRVSPRRGLTLLAREQWEVVTRELGAELPWHTRRANVLVAGVASLQPWIGQSIEIGEVQLEVLAETEPCGMMDRQHPGLRRALTPGCRAGVHGRVVRGGRICVGDVVRLVGPETASGEDVAD